MGSEDSYGATKKEPSKWIQSEIKEKGGKAKQKVKKS
jgi:hypothetical protein